MSLRLSVDEQAWRAHVHATASATRAGGAALVAVVKGNGYGFGRHFLAAEVRRWAEPASIAVGTVHELAGLERPGAVGPSTGGTGAGGPGAGGPGAGGPGTGGPGAGGPEAGGTGAVETNTSGRNTAETSAAEILVLTPSMHFDGLLDASRDAPLSAGVVPTVGSIAHVDALHAAGWQGRVTVKLASSMRRYGVLPDELLPLLSAVERAGCEPCRFMIHPPLIGGHYPESAAVAEVDEWLTHVPQGAVVSVSHLSPTGIGALVAAHADHRFELRLGTALWLGDKHMVQLNADVLDVRPVQAGDTAGYRGATIAADGHLVMVSAGSAHGVAPLADGRSPFHFARQRLTLLEPPHMHTSMVFVPTGQECPGVGDRVDVQRPLISTAVDEWEWR